MGKSHGTNRFLALKVDSFEGEAPPSETIANLEEPSGESKEK